MEKFGVNYAKFQRAIWGKRSCGFGMCGFFFFPLQFLSAQAQVVYKEAMAYVFDILESSATH